MCDPDEQQLHELERITSREPLTPDDKNPEALAMRESWSRLTQLLNAADEEWDSRAFATTMPRPADNVWKRRLALCGALAASLLLCALAVWSRTTRPDDPSALPGSSVAQVTPQPQPPTAASASPSPTTDHQELAWDDTLDERLDNLGGALATVRGSTFINDGRLSILGSRLEQMASEIEASSL